MTRYYSAEQMDADDFGDSFTKEAGEVVYDAKTRMGPWATMTEKSFQTHGLGLLGLGAGQRYVRNEAGELHKTHG